MNQTTIRPPTACTPPAKPYIYPGCSAQAYRVAARSHPESTAVVIGNRVINPQTAFYKFLDLEEVLPAYLLVNTVLAGGEQ